MPKKHAVFTLFPHNLDRLESHGGCKVRKDPKVAKFLERQVPSSMSGVIISPYTKTPSTQPFIA